MQASFDHIAAFEAKVLRGSEEVLVVRVNLAETMLLRADQMERVGGAEE
jgi:hypothetical protein